MIGEELPEFTEEEYNQLSDKDKELVELYKTLPQERKLNGISRWKRVVIFAAGVTLNFILGYILFFFAAVSMPITYAYSNQVTVSENSVAALAGWENDDIIISTEYVVTIDGKEGELIKVESPSSKDHISETNLYFAIVDATENQPESKDDTIHFTFITSTEKQFCIELNPTSNGGTGTEFALTWEPIGITFHPYNRSTTVSEWFTISGDLFCKGSVAIFQGIGMLFTPSGFTQMGGLISVFQMSTQATAMGLYYFLYLWGLISVNLAIFNLLPFPGLDGWQILVTIIEGISRRELPKKFKTIMSYIGFGLLLLLFVAVTFQDILRLF